MTADQLVLLLTGRLLFEPPDCHAKMIPISLLPVVLLASDLVLPLYLCQLSPSCRQTVTSVTTGHQKKSISYSLQAASSHVGSFCKSELQWQKLNTSTRWWRAWTKLKLWGTAGGSSCLSIQAALMIGSLVFKTVSSQSPMFSCYDPVVNTRWSVWTT